MCSSRNFCQPFLTPVPPVGSDALASVLLPFGYAAAAARTAAIAILTLLYVLLVQGILVIAVRPMIVLVALNIDGN